MASLGSVLTDLEDEIRELIYALTPDMFGGVDVPTRFRSPKPGERSKFREFTGQGRLFQIEWTSVKQRTTGCTHRTFDVGASLVIGYPPNGTDLVRSSDYQIIADALSDSQGGASTVSGVSFRLVDYDTEPSEDGDEDWLWYTIPLRAVVETS